MGDKLSVGTLIQNGIQLALKNFVALIVNGILFVLTIWIPYINIGTMIGMYTLPAKMGRDQGISMTEIFDPANRKFMGEFFLVLAFNTIGVLVGLALFYIPGIVIAIAWSLGILLVIDKKLDPIAALRKSNDLTYGNKWPIFLASLIPIVGLVVLVGIGNVIHQYLGAFLMLAGYIALFPVLLGIQAEIYRTLAKNV